MKECKFLQDYRPDLKKEFDIEKNVIPFSQVRLGSHKKIWWNCDKGHSFDISPANRYYGPQNCPYCAKQKVIKGETDFKSLFPEHAEQWDYSKNTDNPDEIFPSNKYKRWWFCEKGHSFQMAPVDKIRGFSCPVCNGRKTVSGINDLKTLFPDIAAEYSKKNKKPVDQIGVKSTKVWWECSKCGGEWFASIAKRCKMDRGCPYCAHVKPLSGKTDLQTYCKEHNLNILDNWSDKNIVSPSEILPFHNKKVIWNCPICESEYKRTVSDEINSKQCPYCSGKRVLPGLNDLETAIPEITKYWDYSENAKLPSDYTVYSNKSVSLICPTCHGKYKTSISHFSTIKDTRGCPYCTRHSLLKGFNDLQTLVPGIENVWDYDLNASSPDEVLGLGAGAKFHFKYSCGHTHCFPVAQRISKEGKLNVLECPFCSGTAILPGFNDWATLYPEVASYWDYEKNGDIVPLGKQSKRSFYWKCENGHSFKRVISKMVRSVNLCPKCAKIGESLYEYELLFYLAKFYKGLSHRKRFNYEDTYIETDIFIPKIKLCIEIDGFPWHKDTLKKDKLKRKRLRELGYKIINIRDVKNLSLGKDDTILTVDLSSEKQRNLIYTNLLKNFLNKKLDIDVKRDKELIKRFRDNYYKEVLNETQTETN